MMFYLWGSQLWHPQGGKITQPHACLVAWLNDNTDDTAAHKISLGLESN